MLTILQFGDVAKLVPFMKKLFSLLFVTLLLPKCTSLFIWPNIKMSSQNGKKIIWQFVFLTIFELQ